MRYNTTCRCLTFCDISILDKDSLEKYLKTKAKYGQRLVRKQRLLAPL